MKYILLTTFFMLVIETGIFGQVAVIANPSAPMDTITKNEILDFYTRDIRFWENKKPVIVFDLKPKGEVKEIFYEFIGKSTSRMKSIWMKKMLSGEGDPPEAVKNEEEMLKKVSSTPGSIGFIPQSLVNENVKVLTIIKSK